MFHNLFGFKLLYSFFPGEARRGCAALDAFFKVSLRNAALILSDAQRELSDKLPRGLKVRAKEGCVGGATAALPAPGRCAAARGMRNCPALSNTREASHIGDGSDETDLILK